MLVGYFVSLLVVGILLAWCGGWVAFDLRLGCDLLRQLVLFGVSLRSSRMFGTCDLLGVVGFSGLLTLVVLWIDTQGCGWIGFCWLCCLCVASVFVWDDYWCLLSVFEANVYC